MKMRKLPLIFLVFFMDMCMVSQIAYGAENGLFLEAGPGISQSLKSEAVLVRFQRDFLQIFGHQSFLEGFYMHWDGHNHADAVGLAGGIRWTVTRDKYVSTALGGCHISRETENLGTPFQFYIRVGGGIRTNRYDVSIAFVHISNGKLFFGWNGPNKGEDFITLSVGGLF